MFKFFNILIENILINFKNLFYIFFLTTLTNYGQELYFNSLNINNQLTKSDVSCLIRDSDGFLWIGTDDGLNRYDGNNVTKFYTEYNVENSLSGNRITYLFEDNKNRIWIGTEGNGLNYFSKEEQMFYRVKTPSNYKSITSIYQENSNNIIIGTRKGLLKIKDIENKITSEVLQGPLNGISIEKIVFSNNILYVATSSGVWKKKENTYEYIKSLGSYNFEDLIVDKHGRLWALYEFKIKIASPMGGDYVVRNFNTKQDFKFKTINVSKNKDIWIGTLNRGLLQVDYKNLDVKKQYKNTEEKPRNLFNSGITFIHCDSKNTLWIANRFGLSYSNLNKKNINAIELNNIKNSKQLPIIRNMINVGDYIYFIIQDENAYRYNLKTQVTEYIDLGKNITPYTLKEIKNTVYISTDKGLYILHDKEKNSFSKKNFKTERNNYLDKNASVIAEDIYGNTYYGNYNGLIIEKENIFNWANDIYPQLDVLKGKRLFTLLFDKSLNCLWIGTISYGLFKMNLDSEGRFISIEEYNSEFNNNYKIPNNNIWGILKGSEGELWVTTDLGLLYLPKDKKEFRVIDNESLRNKKNMGVIQDLDGSLWLTSSTSLINYNYKKNEDRIYTYNDGLNSSFLTKALFIKDSLLYIGTFKGINTLNYKFPITKEKKYQVNFTDFQIYNTSISPNQNFLGSIPLRKSINKAKKISLSHKQNNFLIEFTSNNFTNSTTDKYRYKLEGYDSSWNYTDYSYKYANYSNLDAGDYILKVQLLDANGNWNSSTKEISFEISPAPWLAWYAYMFYFIAICSLLYIILFFWSKKQKLKNELNLNKLIIEKEKDINELKLIFFTDVAHEFKTPLSLIIGPLQDINYKDITLDNFKFNYNIILRNTQRLMHLVNQLLDFRKLNANKNILNVSEGNLTKFVSEIYENFMWQAKNSNIEFNFVSSNSKDCFFDKDIIEKVVYNLLSNAFRYTPKNGKIEIEVKIIWKQNERYANIIVKDSGVGISDINKKEIFKRYFHGKDRHSSGVGLHLSYNLIKAHRGEIIAADSSLGGTEFIILIPVEREKYTDIEFHGKKRIEIHKIKNYENIEVKQIQKPNNDELILIVEDDYDLRTYIRTNLQKEYKIIEAKNGKVGLEIAKNEKPNLIISDVMMPEMDGVTMCKQLRENTSTSHIPTLLLTAKTDDEFRNQGLEAGAWDYIPKPFKIKELIQKIENILETQQKFKQYLFKEINILPNTQEYTSFDQKLILKLKNLIEENFTNNNFTTEELSKSVGLSRMQLHRKLKSLTGKTTKSFINSIKINYVVHMMDNGCDRIQEAMDAVGFTSYSHFNKLFKELKGTTPLEYMGRTSSKTS
ncbi:response regulator [Polaribacter porphyrae]|uniref:histidine kinase n=1 Tax=Polaribacter porphyrae TaxID=1137780 RepID=A0A2S7WR70_9FLAO|nr:response regulator [Polaribacter porphyrae]PQJ79812.1 hypothetical protein BTO18_11780 [Polaribacter porphyrae]